MAAQWDAVSFIGLWLRPLAAAAILLAVFPNSLVAQTGVQPQTLEALTQELEARPDLHDPMWFAHVDTIINRASLAQIEGILPSVVKLTESQGAQQRGNALLLIFGITQRHEASLPGTDIAAEQLVVPYIPRLAVRLFDPATPCRSVSLLIFNSLTTVRPVPPDLLSIAMNVLQDPRATVQLPDTTAKSRDGKAPSVGPQMLWILLPAGATFYRDPATGMTEGQDSPEVQQAILDFLRRPDHTAESRSESIRALALAQPQNVAVNGELLRWLDLPDASVQISLMRNLATLKLSPEGFTTGKARVKQLSNDPAAREDLRALAGGLLGCWSNDRHRSLMCPPTHSPGTYIVSP